ncbi:MAG: hypothetical protein R3C97_01890 [Geminicoccaceae bacterium]
MGNENAGAASLDVTADMGEQLFGGEASSEEVGSSNDHPGTGVGLGEGRAISTIWRRAMERSPTIASLEIPCPGKTSSRIDLMSWRALRRHPTP